jgi:formate hydrogenlyase subunit 3/multisubunit Na+/H+ antiporter MnhD subunit
MIALLAVAAPLVVALGLALPGARGPALRIAPWAAAPAVAVAALAPGGTTRVPWLLFDSLFALDELGRVLLTAAALVWLVAGVYATGYLAADPRRAVFFGFFLLAMAGHLGAILAADLASFYLWFALMTYAAYGLIVHARDEHARRAGRIYLVLAVLGEAAILSGLMLVAAELDGLALAGVPAAIAGSARAELIGGLLFVGFGVKAAILPLHVWLPLAHPVAPTPASAALSGAMIKAGLLGWLRLLPLGAIALPGLGAWALAGGVAAALLAALVGIAQRDPKTVLAYSSISQMGLMTVAIGAGLMEPAYADAAVAAAALLALHHGLAKASLFLAVGVAERAGTRGARALVLGGVALPIAALAGLPLMSGAVAKAALGEALYRTPGAWPAVLGPLVALTSTTTLLVLLRFASTLRARAGVHPAPMPAAMRAAWLASVAATAAAIWIVPWLGAPRLSRASLGDLVGSLWPALVALLALAVAWLARRRGVRVPAVPAGDALVPALWGLRRLRALDRRARAAAAHVRRRAADRATAAAAAWRRAARRVLDAEHRLGFTPGIAIAAGAIVLAASCCS